MRPDELSAAEVMCVALARALVAGPSLLVADDPTTGVGTLERDAILRLLSSVADQGTAVLMSTDDASCLCGAGRTLALDRGKLRADAQAPPADVVPLRPRKSGRESEAHLG